MNLELGSKTFLSFYEKVDEHLPSKFAISKLVRNKMPKEL